jgi:hypothetical protein
MLERRHSMGLRGGSRRLPEVLIVEVVRGADDPPQAERSSTVTVTIGVIRGTQKWVFMG